MHRVSESNKNTWLPSGLKKSARFTGAGPGSNSSFLYVEVEPGSVAPLSPVAVVLCRVPSLTPKP